MAKLSEIRRTFLDFFARYDHEIVASSPLVPRNDPTLMFTNAGMVQFKNVFTGQESPGFSRAASAQKCVRAGGKHNDLDNVGYTARHLTFFEMLGNFSFGDYFKDVAIELAWELVTKDLALAKDRLWVTVFAEDDEAHDLWRRISGLPEERIVRIATSDNFWSMGETGPCGPCSEIFFDHGDKVSGGPPGSPDEDGDRYVEIWNLVFMQYEQMAGGSRRDLPKPSIDTGLGIERLATVLNGVYDVFDTDVLREIIEASAAISGAHPDGKQAVSHRVIADHLRSVSFLIADGVLPSNEGRGYVLRRIMRRAMRHAEILGVHEPMLYRLVPTLVGAMGPHYGELKRAEALIEETLKLEETRFRRTLERGLKILDEETEELGEGGVLPGEVAFKLYDTYGFPIDLTQDALRERGKSVDLAGFEKAMERQRADARKAWRGSGEEATEELWFGLHDEIGATEFLGYDATAAEGIVQAIVRNGERVDEANDGDEIVLVANQTPFYAESGGQVGDTGVIFSPDGARIEVSDTQKKYGDIHAHVGVVKGAPIRVGETVDMKIDARRRAEIRANHSATHLLHAALRRVLGPHVTQKGSLVAPDRLRFDFSHPRAMTPDEIEEVERQVNEKIRLNSEVTTRLMAPDAAIDAGAMALFGEKYGEEVRVLAMGLDDGEGAERPYSVELCGGTHVRRTGDIAFFKIVGESAVSAGVRRLEALTGEAARRYVIDREKVLRDAAAALKTKPEELGERVAGLVEERKRLERELAEARKKLALSGGAGGQGGEEKGPAARTIAGVPVVTARFDDINPKDLRGMIDDQKKKLGSGIVAMIAVNDGKASLAVGVTDDLKSTYNAVDLVKRGAEAVGGKGGGGRPDMAQAGGPEGAKADAALEAITRSIEAQTSAA